MLGYIFQRLNKTYSNAQLGKSKVLFNLKESSTESNWPSKQNKDNKEPKRNKQLKRVPKFLTLTHKTFQN